MSAESIKKEITRIPRSSDFAEHVTRAEIEDLLYYEAALLDSWQLPDWLGLFTSDGCYYVPSTDLPITASADDSLFYIADDPIRLRERVVRLMKKTAHSEYPRSRTRHIVNNIRILNADSKEIKVSAAFLTYRFKFGRTDVYVGNTHYRLRRVDGQLFIVEKRCFLDMEALRPHGRVSIIL